MTLMGAGTARQMAFGALSAALAAGLLATTGRASGGDPDPSVVRTDQGRVRGDLTASARVFHDVPYASPTQEWRGVRDATGAACAPRCRALTVTTPRGVTVGAGLPVHVRLGARPGRAAPGTASEAVVVTVPTGELAGQQAALRWVQRNAVPFGGDPDAVTLLGPPAQLCAHLVSPDSAYLFTTTSSTAGCGAPAPHGS